MTTTSEFKFKVNDLVVHHFCGGAVRGWVVKVNKGSCLVKDADTGRVIRYTNNKLSFQSR